MPRNVLQQAGTEATASSRNPAAVLTSTLQQALKSHSAGDRNAAEQLYRLILEVDPNHADALHLLGLVEYEKQNFQIAAGLMQRAIAADPTQAAFFMDLGSAFRRLGNLRKAAENYIQSLCLNPQSAEAYVNLGNAFRDGDQFDDAVACFRRAIALKPNLIGAHENLANLLRKMCRFDDALITYKRALELNPDRPSTHYNLALLMSDLGEFDQALAHFNRCLQLQIDSPDRVLFLQGLIELLRGDFAAGWDHYERRWGNPDHDTPSRSYAQPLWTGEKLPQGDLFIWGEQGIGDEIMFAGLLPDVLRTGNRCILECDSRLQPLFARSFPAITVVSRPAQMQTLHLGAHIPSGSLPRLFRSNPAAFRATASPYLVPDPVQRRTLRTVYHDGRPLVGLAWKTKSKKSGHLRSIDLGSLAPLFADGSFRVVCLQYGDHEELAAEAKAAQLSLLIDRNVDQLADMDIFAAQIAAMDLVVAIDNSTAHLAGALGVPVWLLLPFVPDWRWQLQRKESPWYPSTRIFRQPALSQWKPVLERVHNALQRFRNCPADRDGTAGEQTCHAKEVIAPRLPCTSMECKTMLPTH